MTKTVKELADELNVSRQYVQKVISKLPATKKPKKVQHSYQIDNRVEVYIRDFMGISDNIEATGDNQNCTSDSNSDSNKYENALLSQIDNLKLQVKQKDFQLENMQKLLDQSQQLQFMAENKIKQLENKSDDIQKQNGEPEGTGQPSSNDNVDESTDKTERGFWSRLFKQ